MSFFIRAWFNEREVYWTVGLKPKKQSCCKWFEWLLLETRLLRHHPIYLNRWVSHISYLLIQLDFFSSIYPGTPPITLSRMSKGSLGNFSSDFFWGINNRIAQWCCTGIRWKISPEVSLGFFFGLPQGISTNISSMSLW